MSDYTTKDPSSPPISPTEGGSTGNPVFQEELHPFRLHLPSVASTNTFLASYRPNHPAPVTLVTTDYQTAGRGQRGNTWESNRAQNLLFSLLLHPDGLPASLVFLLSEAISLAIREALEEVLDGTHTTSELPPVSVKWPNDIYVGDKKVAGILIENDLCGSKIGRCIIGCGVNINQAVFHSDAPNPISLHQLLGHDVDRSAILDRIITLFLGYYTTLQSTPFTSAIPSASLPAPISVIHATYRSHLYRRTGIHRYLDVTSSTPFDAEISDVEPSGHLLMRDTDGQIRRYAFKEVAYMPS